MTQASPSDMASAASPTVTPTDTVSNPAKVFVGGLGQQTTSYSLKAYFSQFGAVEDAAVVIDKVSGRSRGFGFCTFANPDTATSCVASRHKIDGVSCEVRQAIPRQIAQETVARYDSVSQPGKAFVGGLSDSVTEEQLVSYFERFGPVREASLMYDKGSHKPRGFGFVTFERAEDVQQVLGPHPELSWMCDVKLAEPKPVTAPSRYHPDRYAPPAPFRGGRGGRGPPGGGHYHFDGSRRMAERWYYPSGPPHMDMGPSGLGYPPPSSGSGGNGSGYWGGGRANHHPHRDGGGGMYHNGGDFMMPPQHYGHHPYESPYPPHGHHRASYPPYDSTMPYDPASTYNYRHPYSMSSSSHLRARRARPYGDGNAGHYSTHSSGGNQPSSAPTTADMRGPEEDRPASYWVAPPDYLTSNNPSQNVASEAPSTTQTPAPSTAIAPSYSPPTVAKGTPAVAGAGTDHSLPLSSTQPSGGPTVASADTTSLQWTGVPSAWAGNGLLNTAATPSAQSVSSQLDAALRGTPSTTSTVATTTVGGGCTSNPAGNLSAAKDGSSSNTSTLYVTQTLSDDVSGSATASSKRQPSGHILQPGGGPSTSVSVPAVGNAVPDSTATVTAADPYQSHTSSPCTHPSGLQPPPSSSHQQSVALQQCEVPSSFHDPYAVPSTSFARSGCGAATPLSS